MKAYSYAPMPRPAVLCTACEATTQTGHFTFSLLARIVRQKARIDGGGRLSVAGTQLVPASGGTDRREEKRNVFDG